MTTLASRGKVTLVAFAVLALVTALVGCSSENSASESFASQNDAPQPDTGNPVIVAAGDIADCASGGDEATAGLLARAGTVLTMGDNAYDRGTPEEFADCYDPTWGGYKARTYPSLGNHDYETDGAEGYFGYFGKAAGDPGEGYYSYDLGEWHLVALNSNCEEFGGCDASSPQVRWLEADLAENADNRCTLAYWHHPRFSSGEYHGSTQEVKPLWETLYKAGADVVLSSHEHNYERFAPQNPDGEADLERGIREFVVGTGGRSHYPILDTIANSEVHDDNTYCVLELTLCSEGYDWRFVPIRDAGFMDSGSAQCH